MPAGPHATRALADAPLRALYETNDGDVARPEVACYCSRMRGAILREPTIG
jgi:hypothetical protein